MSATSHSPPSEEDCLACLESLTAEIYCEYTTNKDSSWRPAHYCSTCVQYLVDNQFPTYVKSVETSDCERELNALIAAGPPIWVADKHAFPCEEGEHVEKLWYCADNSERSGRLTGSLDGEERQKLWNFHKQFVDNKQALKNE